MKLTARMLSLKSHNITNIIDDKQQGTSLTSWKPYDKTLFSSSGKHNVLNLVPDFA
jgi:hypothetical protein